MELYWNEEFDVDGKPDPKVWSYETGFVRNQELQWYQSDNASVSGGELIILGRKEQKSNPNYNPGGSDWKTTRQYAQYTSSSISSSGRKTWQYGHVEVRARLDAQSGTWPAIWTLGSTGEWPSNGEVDLMEFYPVGGAPTLHANVAWGTSTRWSAAWNSKTRPLSSFTAKDPDWAKKFHVWSMDWNKDTILLKLDGTVMNTTLLNQTVNGDGKTNPFRSGSAYILLNLAIGANGGDPSGATFPAKFEVDYVRVYQKVSTAIFARSVHDLSIRSLPGSHSISVDIPAAGRLDMFSVTGERVLSRTVEAGIQVVDLNFAPSGISLLRLSTPRGAAMAKILR